MGCCFCNSPTLVAVTAAGDPLKLRANSAIPNGTSGLVAQRLCRSGGWVTGRTVVAPSMNVPSPATLWGRAGRTPAHGRPATRRSRVESCRFSRAPVPPRSNKSRVEAPGYLSEAAIKRRCASVYSERQRN